MIKYTPPPAPPRWGLMVLVQSTALSYAAVESETSLTELARGQRRLLAPKSRSLVREADVALLPASPLITTELLHHANLPRGPPSRPTYPYPNGTPVLAPQLPARL